MLASPLVARPALLVWTFSRRLLRQHPRHQPARQFTTRRPIVVPRLIEVREIQAIETHDFGMPNGETVCCCRRTSCGRSSKRVFRTRVLHVTEVSPRPFKRVLNCGYVRSPA